MQNAKYSEVKDDVPPLFFRPYRQDDSVGAIDVLRAHGARARASSCATIPRVVARLDPNLPVEDLKTMPQQVRENVFLDRMISMLSAAFAVLATLLAAVGLYGVLAYTVAQRTREIGLRMALGADPARVRGMVLRQVGADDARRRRHRPRRGRRARPCRGVAALQLKGHDPVVLAVSAVVLALVALGAGLIPAHRASRIDPMRALRYE